MKERNRRTPDKINRDGPATVEIRSTVQAPCHPSIVVAIHPQSIPELQHVTARASDVDCPPARISATSQRQHQHQHQAQHRPTISPGPAEYLQRCVSLDAVAAFFHQSTPTCRCTPLPTRSSPHQTTHSSPWPTVASSSSAALLSLRLLSNALRTSNSFYFRCGSGMLRVLVWLPGGVVPAVVDECCLSALIANRPQPRIICHIFSLACAIYIALLPSKDVSCRAMLTFLPCRQ